ncbi:hypothetical protein ASF61_15535 [Duganella sp. Leaf126]|nr:hypothetical protein ASF61_15535 [Duganella sp. Leaf126]
MQSSFLVAFFGGPAAILLYSGFNSWRLRRLADLPVYALGAALVVGFVYALRFHPALFAGLYALLGDATFRAVRTVLSLAICGTFYALHRKQHRSGAFFHDKAPSPWIPAIACIVAGYGIMIGLVTAVRGMAP